jgi:hypothetical protein
MMSVRFVTATVFLLTLAAQPLAAADLYVREVNEPDGPPKPLRMRFEEVERTPRYSVVQVTFTSGASVPSSMFIVRGMWDIARQRGLPFFINLKEWKSADGKSMYKVGFSDSDRVDVPSFFGESPEQVIFLSVAQFEPLFSHRFPRGSIDSSLCSSPFGRCLRHGLSVHSVLVSR